MAITDFFTGTTNGTRPEPTTVNSTRSIGVTTLSCDALTGWEQSTAVHFVTYKTDADGNKKPGSQCDWKGIVSGTTITNLTLKAGTDVGNAIGDVVVCMPTAAWAEDMVAGILTHANQDGTLKTTAVQSALNLGTDSLNGWNPLGIDVSSVTHNGNRSYDITFASTVAATLSPGMKLLFNKTVAGNGYMGGALNGSSQYFTKTSPSGTLGTVTNNFTIEAEVMQTSYVAAWICGRSDATPNNGFGVTTLNDGRVQVTIWNGGIANNRNIATYQSIPLNKKIHITVTWASGTVGIYFDGGSVPVQAAVTGGTAPTTVGTGGDFSVGRVGAYTGNYLPGYISNVAVFDAVLSAATIKQHATYKLTGSETNCIGAWSLDNTPNDQSSAGNNLTAQGGAGFTAMSPHGQLGDAVQTTKAVGLVMAVNGATVTVQTPEGVTINTTGGISSVAYSVQACPFGWVADKGRWLLQMYDIAGEGGVSYANDTWINIHSGKLAIPVGAWDVSYSVHFNMNGAGGVLNYVTLSTSSSSQSDSRWTTFYNQRDTSVTGGTTHTMRDYVTNTVATDYYLVGKQASGGGKTINTNYHPAKIFAVPAGV